MAHWRINRGTQKPPFGARINPDHPFAKGHLLSVLFNEGRQFSASLPPYLLLGSATPRVAVASPPSGQVRTQNAAGPCWYGDVIDCLSLGPDFIPATAVTILAIRRKVDTTPRQSSLFRLGETAASLVSSHVPWSDGTVYWQFGGTSGANSLTVAGLTLTTNVERWIFTAGPRGSAIWRDGVRVAAQGTAITRTVDLTKTLYLHGNWSFVNTVLGDLEEHNFFAAYDYQWGDELCRWWSAEPYAHLYPPPIPTARVFFGPAAGLSAITGTGDETFATPAVDGSGTAVPYAGTGTGAVAFSAPVVSGSGTAAVPAYTGTAAVAFSAPAIEATALNISPITGAGDVAFAVSAIAGTAAVLNPIIGDGDITIGPPTIDGSGVRATVTQTPVEVLAQSDAITLSVTQTPVEVLTQTNQATLAVTQTAMEVIYAYPGFCVSPPPEPPSPEEPVPLPDPLTLDQWALHRFDLKPRREEAA